MKRSAWRKASPDSARGENPALSRKRLGASLNPPNSELEEVTSFLSGLSAEMTKV